MLLLQNRSSVSLPQRLSQQTTSTRLVRMDILLRLEFNAMLMMSGAIARASDAKQDSAQVFIKGAPFEVAALVGFAALPQGWGAVSISQMPPHLAAAACTDSIAVVCVKLCSSCCAHSHAHNQGVTTQACHQFGTCHYML